MNYDGIEFQIVTSVQDMMLNNSNTVSNIKSMYGSDRVTDLVSKGIIKISGDKVMLSNRTKKDLTPLDLTETSAFKNDKSSSMLFS